MTYNVRDIDENTVLYVASYGAPNCEAEATVIGFSPNAVDARVEAEIASAQRYAAEQCWITEADGTEREAEPEDFPYWHTDALEMPVGYVVAGHSRKWDDAMSALSRYGYASISRL